MITRKSLKDKLQKMHPDIVLFPGYRRGDERSGSYRGHAAEVALEQVIEGTSHFSQHTFYTTLGVAHDTPKWFRQLYTELAWDSHDITPASMLYFLAQGA